MVTATASNRLKGPIPDQVTDRFLKGAVLKFSGVQFQISEKALVLKLESDDDLQKVFEGAANERLDQALPVLARLTAASEAIRRAVAPLKQLYVLIERFSGREICVRDGGKGDIEWQPGYPSDTNYNPDGEAHSLEPVEHLLSTREALKTVVTLLLAFAAAACVGGASYLLGQATMPELAVLITVFSVVFFFHSLLGEGVVKTVFVFLLTASAAWLAFRFIPAFKVDFSIERQLTGEIIGFLTGLCPGKLLGHLYRKIE